MTRIDVPFTINKQRLTQTPRIHICATSRNYFYATFALCDAWADIAEVYAVFQRDVPYIVPLSAGEGCVECQIPWEVMTEVGAFTVGLFGGDRMLTNAATVYVTEGCVCDGENPSEPTADVLRKVLDASTHPPVPNEDGYWRLWDADSKQYVDSAIPITSVIIKDILDVIGVYDEDGAYRFKDEFLYGTDLEDRVSDLEDRVSDLEDSLLGQMDDLTAVTKAFTEQIAGLEAKDASLDKRTTTLEQQVADILYVPIAISSFGHGVGTKEMGDTVKSLTLTWAYNKQPEVQTLNGVELDAAVRSKSIEGLGITMDRNTWPTWTITATDERNKVVSKSTPGFTFLNGVYYGAAAQPATIDSNFVLGLTRQLSGGKITSFRANAGANEYIWYCLPTRMGTCTFVFGANEVTFELVDTLAFTNKSGYEEPYYVYRSANVGLGDTTLGVK